MKHTTKLAIVSFDAVGDKLFDKLLALPVTGPFLRKARVHREVSTVYISNTYPVHTSVLTGLPPGKHGLVRNTLPFPEKHPRWNYREDMIKAETLAQAAYKAGLSVASVLWPVTAGSKSIKYNIPEILPLPGESVLKLNLHYGSPAMQMRLYLKYKKLMRGIEQPELDGFSSTCMADIIRRHRPGLALMHLTAFDSLGHRYGEEREDEALKVLDESFGRILDALGENARVILFSDHAQLSTHTSIIANDLLFNMGLIGKDNQGEYRAGESGSFIECSGGSAFFHAGTLNNTEKEKVKEAIAKNEGFKRWLKDDEMAEAGMDTDDIAAGFCAKEGYEYADYPRDEKAQHGYPLDYPGYKVFYALEGPGIKAETIKGGSLLDIAPLAKKILGIQ